jgi:hypothetical protein
VRRGVVLFLLVCLLPACGGDGGPSEADHATVNAILRSNAALGRAVTPLNLCVPEEPACYTGAGPEVVAVVEREAERVATVLAETDHACLAEVGALYEDVLDAYGEAGRAAVAGDAAAVDAALSRSSERELAYLDKLGECGSSQGRLAEISGSLRAVNADVIRIVEDLLACETDVRCVQETARQLQAKGREGRARVDELMTEVEGEDEVPGCVPPAVALVRESFAALERTAVAVQAGEVETAEREGVRADELRAQAAEDIADCLATAAD